MFEKRTYLFTYDLQGAYHHIYIQEKSECYLGFVWTEGQKQNIIFIIAFLLEKLLLVIFFQNS